MESEIRHNDIVALSERVHKNKYKNYLKFMRLAKVRSFTDAEVSFDFPVTALVGPNGAGKTTVLGAAGLLYKDVPPRRFFAKSGRYDDSMKNWKIEYSALSESAKFGTTISRTAGFRRARWNRDGLARSVLIIGIDRTLPATERTNLSNFIGNSFDGAEEHEFSSAIVTAVQNILGKEADKYLTVSAKDVKSSIFAVKDDDNPEKGYSEFHFGAGEASIIRIVSEIEQAPEQCLMLIEEIENGLHPVATRRLVEYLIEVAKRKSSQIIFTTHSNAALAPLPDIAVWSCYNGRLQQGKLDVEALRTLTGELSCELAVFTEDSFGALLAEVTLRTLTSKGVRFSSIKIHALGGANLTYDHVKFHNTNPTSTFPAIALLDGDKRGEKNLLPTPISVSDSDNTAMSTVFGPGNSHPESAIFDDISENLTSNKNLLGKLTQRLGIDSTHQSQVKESIERRKYTNRDPHLIFAQIGEDLDFLPEEVVARAFITMWCDAFPEKVEEIWRSAFNILPTTTPDMGERTS